MIIVLGFILIGIGILLSERYLRVKRINQKTLKIIKSKTKGHVHPLVKRLSFSSSFQDSLKKSLRFTKEEGALGVAFAGMSILDIYTATNKHEEVLQTVEERFPHEMGDASSFDWLNKVAQLEKNNSSQSYVNAYTGEEAEIESIDKLKELGYENVSQFESKTHLDNDLKAIDREGNEVHFSVKSHKSTASFKQEVVEHPNSKNYVVNSEIYQDMEKSGQLIDYENKGIHIVDGGFSHVEHVQEAEIAFEDIEEAVDVSDDIPIIALASLGYKTFNNVTDFTEGKQSKKELGLNVAVDTAGVGGRAVGALGGAEIGAAVGTAIAPGIGTVVGGIGGAIAGSKVTSEIIKDVKEKWKWGKIIAAIDYYGRIYHPIFLKRRNFHKRISKRICDEVYNCSPVIKNLKAEKKIYKNNSHFLSRLCLYPRNIKETLILEYMKSLKKYLNNARAATAKSFKNVQTVLKSIEKELPKEEKDIRMKRYIGEFVIENKEIFIEMDSIKEAELLRGYRLQKEECPNHPYKVLNDSNKYFKQMLWKTLKEVSA